MVDMLLKHGADINLVSGKYSTALGAAAFHNNARVVDFLLDSGANINRARVEYGTAIAAAGSSSGLMR